MPWDSGKLAEIQIKIFAHFLMVACRFMPAATSLSVSVSLSLCLSVTLTSIAQLIKASDYACTPYGQVPGSSLGLFLNELPVSLSLTVCQSLSLTLSLSLSLSLDEEV